MNVTTKSITYRISVPHSGKDVIEGSVTVTSEGRASIEREGDAYGTLLSIDKLEAMAKLYREAARLARQLQTKIKPKK